VQFPSANSQVRCGSDATLFCKHKQTNLKNKPNVRLVGKFKKREVSRLVKYKNREANPKKQTQNEQICTTTRPNFVLQYVERAKWP